MAERGRPEVINAENVANVAMPCIREIAIGNNNFVDSETLLRTEDWTNGTDDGRDTAAAKRRKRKKIPAGRRGGEGETGRGAKYGTLDVKPTLRRLFVGGDEERTKTQNGNLQRHLSPPPSFFSRVRR